MAGSNEDSARPQNGLRDIDDVDLPTGHCDLKQLGFLP
jgi:hypothetical protein